MKIQLINQSTVSDTDFKNVVAAMQAFVPMVTKAWNIPDGLSISQSKNVILALLVITH
jgi:hypothetical protein